MPRSRRLFTAMLTLAAAFTGSAFVQIVQAQDGAIRVAIEGNFPPFNYLDSNGDLQGFDVEIAEALCAAMTKQCEFVIQPWDEMIPGLLEMKYDAIVSSMSMSAERREKVDFTSRYYDSPSTFITAKTSSLSQFTPEVLDGKRLGVTLSTSQEAYAKHFLQQASIVVFDASPKLYEGLATGQVDVIIEDKLAAYDWLANTRAGQCCEFRGEDIKDPTYFGDGAGIAVRKKDDALLTAFEAALATVTADGTYDTINAEYFPFPIR